MKETVEIDLKQGRSSTEVMLNCRNGTLYTPLRHALNSIGFARITSCPTYAQALALAEEKDFSLIFFDAVADQDSEISNKDFIGKFLKIQEGALMIGVSAKATAENIFQVVRHGARTYLIPPFAPDVIEETLVRVTQKPKISKKLLEDPNRNQALAGMVLDHLDNLADYINNIQTKLKSEEDKPDYEAVLDIGKFSALAAESTRMAKQFCEGTVDDLLEQLVNETIRRTTEKSQLRLTRERLQRNRKKRRR